MSFPDLGRLSSLSLFLVAPPRPCPVQGTPSSQFLNGGQRLRCGQAARRTPLVGIIPHGDRNRPPAAARIAVQLREYHVVEIETFIKFFRRIDGILTGHRIDYEQRLRRLDRRQGPAAREPSLHLVGECLGHLIVNVCVNEGASNLFQYFGGVGFGDTAKKFTNVLEI